MRRALRPAVPDPSTSASNSASASADGPRARNFSRGRRLRTGGTGVPPSSVARGAGSLAGIRLLEARLGCRAGSWIMGAVLSAGGAW